jgi:hypothetical protein
MNIQDAICLARDLVASPRVSMLVDDNLIELSGSPDVNIVDMDIRISGHSHSPEVEINSLETEVELADIEISIDYNYAHKVMIDIDDLIMLVDMLQPIEVERAEMQAKLDAARAELDVLKDAINTARYNMEMSAFHAGRAVDRIDEFFTMPAPQPTPTLDLAAPLTEPQREVEADWYI